MGYDVRAVANFVLDIAESEGSALSNLAINKVVFFLHAYFLVHFGRPLVSAKVEAWNYGPVFRELYREFKSFEDQPIGGRAYRISAEHGVRELCLYDFSNDERTFLQQMARKYIHLSTRALVAMSHEKDGPWDQVWNHVTPTNASMRISDEIIKDWYEKSCEALMAEYKDEIKKLLKILRKLDHPPAGPNWVRFIHHADPARTAKAIVRFAKGQPPFNYQPAYRAIRDRIELGIDLGAALHVASKRVAPSGLVQNRELVEAFFEHDKERQYSASNPIGFELEYFRVSREVLVPVAPLSIIRERGKFVPIFVCGWTSNPLLLIQRRLLMTIYEDAFLSLTDYQNSPAEVLFFPKNVTNEDETTERERQAEVWPRGAYELLSQRALDECVEVFIAARDVARSILLAEIEVLRAKAEEEATQSPADQPVGGDLFSKK